MNTQLGSCFYDETTPQEDWTVASTKYLKPKFSRVTDTTLKGGFLENLLLFSYFRFLSLLTVMTTSIPLTILFG